MKSVLAHIPTHVVHGGSAAGRAAVIGGLIAKYAHHGLLSVFRTGIVGVDTGGPGIDHRVDHRVIARIAPIGCACCTGKIAFRVALVQALRTDRPTRLIIELASGSHVEAVKALLQDQFFAGVLDVIESVDPDHS